MSKTKFNIIFRKPGPQFNSIETVFNAILPYFEDEFEVNIINLPFRTHGIAAMRKNIRFLRTTAGNEIMHVTGHDNYVISAGKGRTILTLHDIGSAFTGKRLRDFFISWFWFRRPMKRADMVTVISLFSREELIARYPSMDKKCRVIPNPVDDRINFTPKPFNDEKPVIFQVGTKENKNIERVAEALQGISCKLLVLGELSDKQAKMLHSFKIDYECKYHLSYDQVLKLYEQCDILLYASLYEGFGMPILEAQTTGRVVITSNVAAMPSTAGNGACFVDPLNVTDIRKAVERVISDKDYREHLISKGVENAKIYTAKAIAGQYLKVYREVSEIKK